MNCITGSERCLRPAVSANELQHDAGVGGNSGDSAEAIQDPSSPAPDSSPRGGSGAFESDVDPGDVSLDTVFDILRNSRRRLVLQAIEDRDGSTTLSDLAEHIGGIENDKPPHALYAQERKRVYVGLYQCHLPRMDDAGAIEFERNRGTVKRGPHAEAFTEYLEQADTADTPWYRYYGALSLSGCLGVFAASMFASSVVPAVVSVAMFSAFLLATVHAVAASDSDLSLLRE